MDTQFDLDLPPETVVELRRPTLRARWGAVLALVGRDWLIMRSYRSAFITDLCFGFLNLVVFYYISRSLHVRVGSSLGGAPSYFAYAAVGVALSIVLQAAVIGVSRRLREEQLTGTLEALLVQPVGVGELALGLAGFPFAFAMFRAVLYLCLAAAVLGLSLGHCNWLGLVVSFVVSAGAMGSVGVALAALVLVFKRAESAGSVGMFAMSLLGGAFFPIYALPKGLEIISRFVPTRYAFESARAALFGRGDWLGPAMILAGMGLVVGVIGFAALSLALRLAIDRGTINQY